MNKLHVGFTKSLIIYRVAAENMVKEQGETLYRQKKQIPLWQGCGYIFQDNRQTGEYFSIFTRQVRI
jgi:hypothetical protein